MPDNGFDHGDVYAEFAYSCLFTGIIVAFTAMCFLIPAFVRYCNGTPQGRVESSSTGNQLQGDEPSWVRGECVSCGQIYFYPVDENDCPVKFIDGRWEKIIRDYDCTSCRYMKPDK